MLAGRAIEEEAIALWGLGVPAVLLFAVLAKNQKDEVASAALVADNAACQAIKRLKQSRPELVVIADLCLCEYTSHGHCGILKNGCIDNGKTLEVLSEAALVMAQAGADVIAPSGVMDGTVQVLRQALDQQGMEKVALMPYSAKYASCFYGPFKQASQSTSEKSLHATHQIQAGNQREALYKIQMDIEEGADIVIIKPALTSLDIIALAKTQTKIPLAGYDVSGFYKMMHDYGGTDKELWGTMQMEVLTCIKRAGAAMIITYFAKEAARLLQSGTPAFGG